MIIRTSSVKPARTSRRTRFGASKTAIRPLDGFTPFPDGTIPGAVGPGSRKGSDGGENVLVADGSFVYLVDHGWREVATPPPRSALVAAAGKVHARAHVLP